MYSYTIVLFHVYTAVSKNFIYDYRPSQMNLYCPLSLLQSISSYFLAMYMYFYIAFPYKQSAQWSGWQTTFLLEKILGNTGEQNVATHCNSRNFKHKMRTAVVAILSIMYLSSPIITAQVWILVILFLHYQLTRAALNVSQPMTP